MTRCSPWPLALCLPLCLGTTGCISRSASGEDTDGPSDGGRGSIDLRPPERSPLAPDAACVSVREEAKLERRPVDIIIVVDNSASMTDEILAVEKTSM